MSSRRHLLSPSGIVPVPSPIFRSCAGEVSTRSALARRAWSQVRWAVAHHPLAVVWHTRARLARTYIRGEGVEIGALHHPLPVSRHARVRYVDRYGIRELRRQYPELRHQRLVPVDIVDDGEQLCVLGDETQDFVIANHFLEHCENPIGTIRSLLRVLRPGGILFLAIPDKRYTFDVDRPVTPLAHLLRDDREGPAWSRSAHYEEWVRLARWGEKADEQATRERIAALMAMNYSIHYHVWTPGAIMELLGALQTRLGFPLRVEQVVARNKEVICILCKNG